MTHIATLTGYDDSADSPTMRWQHCAISISAGSINENIAVADIQRAFDRVSHFPERAAGLALRDLSITLNDFAQYVDGLDHAHIERNSEIEKFAARYLADWRDLIAAYSNSASAFIVGPSNFPTRRMEKINRRIDNKVNALNDLVERAKKSVRRRAYPNGATGDPIRANDPQAAEKLAGKAAQIDNEVERMKAINAAWRKAGRPGRTATDDAWQSFFDSIADITTDAERQAIRSGMLNHYMASKRPSPPFESWQITNARNRATSAAVRARQIQAVRGKETTETQHGDITVREDANLMRIQLIFPGKPDHDTRATLKKHGFRWAPSHGAWQRQLTNAARHAADMVVQSLRECGQ